MRTEQSRDMLLFEDLKARINHVTKVSSHMDYKPCDDAQLVEISMTFINGRKQDHSVGTQFINVYFDKSKYACIEDVDDESLLSTYERIDGNDERTYTLLVAVSPEDLSAKRLRLKVHHILRKQSKTISCTLKSDAS